MKTYKKHGERVDYKHPTMTVGELVHALQKYPGKMPIAAEWEGTYNAINIEKAEIKKRDGYFVEDTLVFWVEDY